MTIINKHNLAEAFDNLVAEEFDSLNKDIIQAEKEAFNAVVDSTRVDTSLAVSNWQVHLAANPPVTAAVLPHFPGERGSTAEQSSFETKMLGEDVLRQKSLGQPVSISNFVDYIVDLDQGTEYYPPADFERVFSTVLSEALQSAGRGGAAKARKVL